MKIQASNQGDARGEDNRADGAPPPHTHTNVGRVSMIKVNRGKLIQTFIDGGGLGRGGDGHLTRLKE